MKSGQDGQNSDIRRGNADIFHMRTALFDAMFAMFAMNRSISFLLKLESTSGTRVGFRVSTLLA